MGKATALTNSAVGTGGGGSGIVSASDPTIVSVEAHNLAPDSSGVVWTVVSVAYKPPGLTRTAATITFNTCTGAPGSTVNLSFIGGTAAQLDTPDWNSSSNPAITTPAALATSFAALLNGTTAFTAAYSATVAGAVITLTDLHANGGSVYINTAGSDITSTTVDFSYSFADTFLGVHPYLEEPDYSGVTSKTGTKADTVAVSLDGAGLPAKPIRQDIGRVALSVSDLDAMGLAHLKFDPIAAPLAAQTWRLYLPGYTASYDSVVVLPNPAHSPTKTFAVDGSSFAIGEEYAPLVTNPQGRYVTMTNVDGSMVGQIIVTWDDPDPIVNADRIRLFSGVQVDYYQSTNEVDINVETVAPGVEECDQSPCPIPATLDTVTVFLRSVGLLPGQVNSLCIGVTPSVVVTTSLAPTQYASNVSNFLGYALPVDSVDGVSLYQFTASFQEPLASADPKFGGGKIIARPSNWPTGHDFEVATFGLAVTQATGESRPCPTVTQTFKLYGVSCDKLGNYNDIDGSTPYATVTTPLPGSGIPTSRLDPSTYDNTVFGHAPDGTFKIISIDLSLAKPGSFDSALFSAPVGGPFNMKFDTTIFDSSSGYLKIKALDASKITANIFSIGGAGAPAIYVWDNAVTPQLIGWIGTNSSLFGAWFKQMWVGGASPASAKLYIDGLGNLQMVGTLTGAASQFTGAITGSQLTAGIIACGGGGSKPTGITIYDATTPSPLVVGWIGESGALHGGWFKNLYAGGTGYADAFLRVEGPVATYTGALSSNTIYTPTISGGTISGTTLTLTFGGVTTSLANNAGLGYGVTGMYIYDSVYTNNFVKIGVITGTSAAAQGSIVINAYSGNFTSVVPGYLSMHNGAGDNLITLDAISGSVISAKQFSGALVPLIRSAAYQMAVGELGVVYNGGSGIYQLVFRDAYNHCYYMNMNGVGTFWGSNAV